MGACGNDARDERILYGVKIAFGTTLSGRRLSEIEAVRSCIAALLQMEVEGNTADVLMRHKTLAHMFRTAQALAIQVIGKRVQCANIRTSRLQHVLQEIELCGVVLRSIGIHALLQLTTAPVGVLSGRIPFATSLPDSLIAACVNRFALPIHKNADGWYLSRNVTYGWIDGLWHQAIGLSARARRIERLLWRLRTQTRRLTRERASACEMLVKQW